ncbi:MAG: SDR family NAD(P)-dependent oxidoreductase [Anaerolineales bacterium]|nr:SDR family NAD(P)-dependent oxidoreductase [Anaerolineales bacterium]
MTRADRWTAEDIPDQMGKVALVTGGNSGLGYVTVKELARKRAHVILACRNTLKGEAARDQICRHAPDASIEVMKLDLASLALIRQFAEAFKLNHDRLHILVNNAGIMATPRQTTADGFELQFGTNHLGHFALTGLLLDVLVKTPNSRVVTVSSNAEPLGRINMKDLMRERFYERWLAYAQSKLANVLFAYELQRRLNATGASTISLAVHPGVAATNLRKELLTRETPLFHRIQGYVWESLRQSAEMGALSQLYAATALSVKGGEFYAPGGFLQLTGHPKKLRSSRKSYDEVLAKQLWDVSEELTGVEYEALAQ